MFRNILVALTTSSVLYLSACSNTQTQGDFNTSDVSADPAQIIANQIEGVSSKWHKIVEKRGTWFAFEREFGGVHGLADIKAPSQYGRSLCEAQGGRFYFVISEHYPRNNYLRQESNGYMFVNLRDSFGKFSCLKDGLIAWHLQIASDDTQAVEGARLLVDPPYKTTVLFRSYTMEEDPLYNRTLELANKNNRIQLQLAPDGTLTDQEKEKYTPPQPGQKVCTGAPSMRSVGYVQQIIGEQVIFYRLAFVARMGARAIGGGRYDTGSYWEFTPCDAWVNSPF